MCNIMNNQTSVFFPVRLTADRQHTQTLCAITHCIFAQTYMCIRYTRHNILRLSSVYIRTYCRDPRIVKRVPTLRAIIS